MKDLTELFLNGNELVEIPNVRGLRSLNRLDLYKNNIRQISDDAFEDNPISVLLLHDNLLEGPPNLSTIATSLLTLSMGNNQLSSFPGDYFSVVNKLKVLYLDRNQLKTVPRLHGMQLVNKEDNSMELRPGDFRGVSINTLLLL
jgi:Leucine-rich repeat (LRR) protein